MVDPISTVVALKAAHKAFHAAHPHICNFAHKLANEYASKVTEEVLREVDKKIKSQKNK
jgi:hypothetical protein